jgi:electron transfer flavoprotein alpha subunit
MIVLVAEPHVDRASRASLEALAAAQAMRAPITVVVLGDGAEAAAHDLAAADGVVDVVVLDHERLHAYTADAWITALAAFLRDVAPSHVVFAHTYQTRDYVPRLAARLDRALVTDCTGVSPIEGGATATFTRPMFQGKIQATVALDGPAPHLATIQIGAFRADAVRMTSTPAPVRVMAAAIDAADIHQQVEPPFREAKQAVDLTRADRIVAAGRGVGSQDGLTAASELAAALGAELAASRPVCDAGWLPMDRQIGSSGQTVTPRLYVALGVSGAIQHIVGMKGSQTIVAINKDADAPIFEVADYGIVGDLFEIVPAIVAALT